jgi:hypothetical protein
MATDIKDTKRTINMKAKIMIVGDSTITLNLASGPVQRIVLPASKEDEQWAGARLYHFVDVAVTIGPGT